MVTLRNLGNDDAPNVTARLRSGHPQFTVTDSVSVYGNIPAGESRSNDADRFAATAAAAIPPGTLVPCTLHVRSGPDQDWTWTFTVVVGVRVSPPGRYLIIHTDSSRPDSLIRALEDMGDTIELFDARTATPTLELLAPYGGAIVFSRSGFANPVGLGDVLADFVDLGRGLVIANLALTTGLCPQGRVMTGVYLALVPGSVSTATANLGWFDPNHQIMTGLGTVTDLYRSQVALAPGADSVAKWDDGKHYVATSFNQRVVGINQFPSALNQNRMLGRDWAKVYHQALAWARGSTGLGAKPGFVPGSATIVCRPNPLRHGTAVTGFLAEPGECELSVRDAAGRTVRTLARGRFPAGFFSAAWDRTDEQARLVPSGVYFCVLEAGRSRTSQKLIVE